MRLLPILMWALACATAVDENPSSIPEHITIRLESDDPVVSRLIEEEWEVIDSTSSSTTTTTVSELTVEITQDDVSSNADIDSKTFSSGSGEIELMKQTEFKSMDERLDNFTTSNWWMYVLAIACFSKIIASYVA